MGYTSDDPDAERALRAPSARRILEAVERTPGVSLSEIRRRTGLGWGTLYHHLARLHRASLVTLQKRGRHRCVFPRGHRDAPPRPPHHGRTRRRVATAILELQPATVERLTAHTGLSRRVVYHHAKQLIEAGLVERSRDDRMLRALPDLPGVLND